MSESQNRPIVRIYESEIKSHLNEIIRSSVEDTLNAMLDQEADQICSAKRYEGRILRSEAPDAGWRGQS